MVKYIGIGLKSMCTLITIPGAEGDPTATPVAACDAPAPGAAI